MQNNHDQTEVLKEGKKALYRPKDGPVARSRPFIPMFFSLDVIMKKSLYILEMNKGYTSGYKGLGEDMTYITYLHFPSSNTRHSGL